MSVLHGASASPFVRKVRVALQEKGIAYELDPILPFNVSDEYKKMSPLGKIPCYTPKEGVNIPDSSVIVAYLERTNKNNPLYPENAEDFARALFLEEYGDSALVAALGTVFFQRIVGPTLPRPEDRRGGHRRRPREADSAAAVVAGRADQGQGVLRRQPSDDRRHRDRVALRQLHARRREGRRGEVSDTWRPSSTGC